MIDRVKVEKAFMEYADNYDTSDVMIDHDAVIGNSMSK